MDRRTVHPMNELNAQISAALRTFMGDRDITQQQVADALGRSQGYVSQRTSGRRDLSVDIIAAVAELAHLTPRALMVELTERMTTTAPQ
jgi:transcriptional regulator with XRE-family HTH domain